MPVRALIVGVRGHALTPEEIAFLREVEPWGLILFRRNVRDAAQLSDLTRHFRETVGRADAPVLIDQEGGRVQRMGPPLWPAYPRAAIFGRLMAADRARGLAMARLAARLMAHDLAAVGIDVDCLPVLDVPVPGAHDVIGDRAYSHDPAEVAALGRAVAEGLMAGGVLPVMKHMPGHGRAGADSHLALPVVDASLEALDAHDFAPFRALADLPMGMSAHVVYRAVDPDRPGTVSPAVIGGVVRGRIGFDGLLMTDDLSMRALSGSFAGRAAAAIAAGCDIVLHCNGEIGEMRETASGVPELAGRALARARAALARKAVPARIDVEKSRGQLAVGLAAMA
jgi:beta-N-acetylhexosaminidase